MASKQSRGANAEGQDGSKEVPCRIQLVGMFPAAHEGSSSNDVVRQHLGLFTLPSTQEEVTLLKFGQQLQHLVAVQGSPEHQHFRFEYSCFGHMVPILSDAALKEALSYFRDQARQLGQMQATQTCTLYLWPATSARPLTLAQYLQESKPQLAQAQVNVSGRSDQQQQQQQGSGLDGTGEGSGRGKDQPSISNPELSPSSSRVMQQHSGSNDSKAQSALPPVGAGAWAGGPAEMAVDAGGVQELGTSPAAAAATAEAAGAGGVLFGLTPVDGSGLGLNQDTTEPEAAESKGSGSEVDVNMLSSDPAEVQTVGPVAQPVSVPARQLSATQSPTVQGQGQSPGGSGVGAAGGTSAGVSRTGSHELPVGAAAAELTQQQQQQQQWALQPEGVSAMVLLQQPLADPTAAAAGAGLSAAAQLRPSHKRPADEIIADGFVQPLQQQPSDAVAQQLQQQQQHNLLLHPRRGLEPTAHSALTTVLSSGLSGGTEGGGALSPSLSAGSSRADSLMHRTDSNKAARRSTAQSPRAEQQQHQQQQVPELQLDMGVWFAQQQQQQQQKQQPGRLSPFMNYNGMIQQQQQQSGGFAAPMPGAAGYAFGSVQQVMLEANCTSSSQQAAAAAAAAVGGSSVHLGGMLLRNGSDIGSSASGFVAAAQMQQLQISSNSGQLDGPGSGMAGLTGPGAAGYAQLNTQTSFDVAAAAAAAAAASGLLPGTGFPGTDSVNQLAAEGAAAAAPAAAAVPAAGVGGAGVAAGDGAGGAVWQVTSGGRMKSETKTKYADGRFKDEARHQQRLSDMRDRCNALFDGTIRGHFQVEHHKKVMCLVCNSVVVPYEAYHIDAVRKHFVRHHEAWLTQAGCNVDIWRKSCAPIGRTLAAQAAAAAAAAATAGRARKSSGSGTAAAAPGDGMAAVAAGDGSSDDIEAAAAADEDGAELEAATAAAANGKGSGRVSSTRLADGRYKDPLQHQQRMVEMESRCAALFNGAVSSHWTITSHKSINCHLCNTSITPYAAYHPDCLRKHFVRRHEDVLVAAGVDVAVWSKGIPLGRRKLKAMQQHQQQQQQQQLMLAQQQALLQSIQQQQQAAAENGFSPGVAQWASLTLPQLQQLQQQPSGGMQALLTGQIPNGVTGMGAAAAAAAAAGEAGAPPPLWSWLGPGGQQQQQQQGLGEVSAPFTGIQQQQQQQRDVKQEQFVFGSTPMQLSAQQTWQQQQQQWSAGMVTAARQNSTQSAALGAQLTSPLMAVVQFGDSSQTGVTAAAIKQQQQTPAGSPAMRISSSSSVTTTQPMQQLDLDGAFAANAAAGLTANSTITNPAVSVIGPVGRHSPNVTQGYGVVGQQTGGGGFPGAYIGEGPACQMDSGIQEQLRAIAAVAAAAGGAAAVPVSSGLTGLLSQQQQQQGQALRPPLGPTDLTGSERGASLRQLAAEWARSPSMAELPPGFGPMSLTPSAAAAEAGLAAAAGSLTDADFAELLTVDDDAADLDDLLAKHANWVFEAN